MSEEIVYHYTTDKNYEIIKNSKVILYNSHGNINLKDSRNKGGVVAKKLITENLNNLGLSAISDIPVFSEPNRKEN